MMCADFRLKDMRTGPVTITLEMPESKQDRARIANYAYCFIGCIKKQAQKRIQSAANAMDSNN